MATTYRYLAVGGEDEGIRAWFTKLKPPPTVIDVDGGAWFNFREFGPLARDAAGAIDVEASPLVAVTFARKRRGVLWSAGEVHFRTKRLPSVFPGLEGVRRQFDRWLRSFDLVWDGRSSEWEYFLEGSIQNHDSRVYALPRAMSALRDGAYFVSDSDGEGRLDPLCKKLALRGVACVDDPPSG